MLLNEDDGAQAMSEHADAKAAGWRELVRSRLAELGMLDASVDSAELAHRLSS